MAKEILIQEWCDVCLGMDSQNRAPVVFSYTVTIGGVSRDLALCEVHTKQEMSLPDWADVLQRVGTKPGAAPLPPGKLAGKPMQSRPTTQPALALVRGNGACVDGEGNYFCPVDACDYTSSTEGGWAQHVRKHDLSPALLRMGLTEPRCPLCEFEGTVIGLVGHMRKAHEAEWESTYSPEATGAVGR